MPRTAGAVDIGRPARAHKGLATAADATLTDAAGAIEVFGRAQNVAIIDKAIAIDARLPPDAKATGHIEAAGVVCRNGDAIAVLATAVIATGAVDPSLADGRKNLCAVAYACHTTLAARAGAAWIERRTARHAIGDAGAVVADGAAGAVDVGARRLEKYLPTAGALTHGQSQNPQSNAHDAP